MIISYKALKRENSQGFLFVRCMEWDVGKTSLPKVNSTKYGLKCFSYYAAKYWNTQSDNIRTLAGTKDFVSKVRSLTFYIFILLYHSILMKFSIFIV